MEREPLRGALADAGQARELGDEPVDRCCEQGPSSVASRAAATVRSESALRGGHRGRRLRRLARRQARARRVGGHARRAPRARPSEGRIGRRDAPDPQPARAGHVLHCGPPGARSSCGASSTACSRRSGSSGSRGVRTAGRRTASGCSAPPACRSSGSSRGGAHACSRAWPSTTSPSCCTSRRAACCGRRTGVRALVARAREAGAQLLAGRGPPGRGGVRFGSDRLEADAVVWACGAWLGHLFPDLVRLARDVPAAHAVRRAARVARARVGRLRRRLLRPRPRGAVRDEGRGRPRRRRGGPGRAAARGHAGGGRAGARVPGPPLPGARRPRPWRNARLPLRAHRRRPVPLRPAPRAPWRLAPRRRLRARLQARAGAGRARGGGPRRPGEPEPRFALGERARRAACAPRARAKERAGAA